MPAPASPLRKYRLLALVLIPVVLWVGWFSYGYHGMHRLPGPKMVYWAWERPEDLRFLNQKSEGVAFLANSVELLEQNVRLFPRMQPLYIRPGTQLVAVVRVYSHADHPPALDEAQFRQTLAVLLAATRERNVSALQIDYDARASERAFYIRLLLEARRQLGSSFPISITALASWCISDRWIRDLPIDEAVPMLFSMGKDESLIRQYLTSVDTFPEPLCRGSVGISTGEWWPNPISYRTRVYVFNQAPWTREAVASVEAHLHRGI
jgi:hypothetical protein